MLPGTSPRVKHALLYLLAFTAITSAQQQHQQSGQEAGLRGRSIPEHDRPSAVRHDPKTLEGIGKEERRKAAVFSTNERAIATFAPSGDIVPDVRAYPAKASGSPRALSRQSARSLQDWQVEDIVLLATVDGKIYARERISGAPRWELEVDHPMVQTTYHAKNMSKAGSVDADLLWIVEPSQDGALYVYSPHSRLGMQRLGLTVRQLVEELSPYAGEEPPVVYTAEKKNTLYTIDAANGNILKMFSSNGSVMNNERSCRKVNGFEHLDDRDCEPIGTLTLGRTEYTVGIQDKDTGDPICTISYFEWGPNNRDKDLQTQYSSTLDNRYVYAKHDGSVMALEHSGSETRGRRRNDLESVMYSQKFASPVVRVYDVVRPHLEEPEVADANLVVLPQPVGPVNEGRLDSDSIFVNCTEAGSWYALSEQMYPLVTAGAKKATCYDERGYMPRITPGDIFDGQKSKLVGLHPLSAASNVPGQVPAIGAPEVQTPSLSPPKSTLDNKVADDYRSAPWSSTLPSPFTLVIMALISLTAIPSFRAYVLKAQKNLLSKEELSKGSQPRGLLTSGVSVDVQPTAETDGITTLQSAESLQRMPKVRSPEPAEETIFSEEPLAPAATAPTNESSLQAGEQLQPERSASPDSAAESQETPKAGGPNETNVEASPAPEKKKARRGVRGGRKLKEKKMEQEAQQRLRASSQSHRNSISLDLSVVPEAASQQTISIAASESPTIAGTIQINNLIINTDCLIGRGSAGTCVFEGTFGVKKVAVKRMLSQYYELASQEVVFLQENDDCENVVRYYCSEKDQNFLYIAVELCQASLWDLFYPEFDKQDLSSEILTAIQQDVPSALYQIVEGLKHLHDRRIIHRDIKPQNILIGRPTTKKNPRLVLSDFGLCKTLPDNMSTLIDPTNNAGTSGWKAPELITQPKDSVSLNGHSTSSLGEGLNGNLGGVKRAADIFSLGCLFFWVLTGGCHPFDDKEGWAQIRELNIKKNNLQNMHKLDLGSDTEEPVQLITAMLSHRPEDRPNVNDILEHPFFWKPKDRLAFLCDVSDHFERETRDPPSEQLQILESYASTVIEKGDFLKVLPKDFVDTLGKQRKYTGGRMLDLLRALRNKRNHYEDMPDEVKRKVGPLPNGYLNFWTGRFPKLLMACYWIVRECGLNDSERFRQYFVVGGEAA